jgi:hypothetical protein
LRATIFLIFFFDFLFFAGSSPFYCSRSFPYFIGVFSTRYRKRMGNGNVLRVVGRDARGRESTDLARAARFVREHATELGVGAALLGGAILGTLHKNWAVPTEPVNELDLHMPRPGPAPNVVAKEEISADNPSLPATAPEVEQAKPKEEWMLEEVQETPPSAFSDPPESAGENSLRDLVNATYAAAKARRAADAAENIVELEKKRKERDERIKREKPARDEAARREQLARDKAFKKAFEEEYVADLKEIEENREEAALKAAFDFFKVQLKARPSEEDARALEKAMRELLRTNHVDKRIGDDEEKIAEARTAFELAKAHYKFIQNSKRLSRMSLKLKTFGNNMFGEGMNVRDPLSLGAGPTYGMMPHGGGNRAAAYRRAPLRGFV